MYFCNMENLKVTNEATALVTLLTETLYKVDNWNTDSGNNYTDKQSVVVVSEPENISTPAGNSTQVVQEQASTPTYFDYLGENNKYVLVLVNYPDSKHITDKDKEFFLKVISALKLTIEDVAVLNYAHYASTDINALKEYFSCSRIITFGVPQSSAVFRNVNMQDYSVTNVYGISLLPASDTLRIIESDKNKKIVLWNALKLLFNVK
ncbi:hypothetical protein D3C80_293850 [compost metagenome]